MKELTLKTHWNEITVGEYQKLTEVMDSNEGLDRELKLIEILSDKTYEELLTLNSDMLKLIQSKLDFLNTYPNGNLKYEFVINNTLYNPVLIIDKITTGRFLDIIDYTENTRDNLHLLFATLLRENQTPYNEMQIDILSNYVKNEVSIEDVFGLINYYTKLYVTTYQVVEDSMEGDTKIEMMKNNPLKALKLYMRELNDSK